jgi:hypothetical protein
VGGPLMTSFFTFGAAVSVVGLLCTLLCSSSRIIYGMAMVGTLPKVFAKTSAQVRFCRDRFSATGDLRYTGIRANLLNCFGIKTGRGKA